MHECHTHSHSHTHETPEASKSLALLTYMLEHNRHHAEELHDLAHSLSENGSSKAAELLHAAVEDFQQGNEKLAAALAALKEAE